MKQFIILTLSTVAIVLSVFKLAVCADGDIERHRDCRQCGMDRKAYGYSRMLVEYKDGTQAGTCSLHCMITELNRNNGKEIRSMYVADRDTREMIDAEKAIWVIGGKKRGVMTMLAKWAFSSRETAQKFVDGYGGTITYWKEAFAAAQ